jgi:uncharacterized protein (TIGR03663 family)
MKLKPLFLAGCFLVVLVAAALLRLPRLAMRPMHADEANQAVRAGILWETGQYHYDAADHHGPTLYWLTLPALWLSGAADFAQTSQTTYRAVPVVFGLGLIVLTALLWDGLGAGPALVAAALAALSPAMVFYSRYYIQETLLVFFTLAAVGSAWRYLRRPSAAWAIVAGASLGLMAATKETWILTASAMAVAGFLNGVGRQVSPFAPRKWRSFAERKATIRDAVLAVLAACFVAAAFYSSFGTNWGGVGHALGAYGHYFRRGSESGIHTHPWYYYLQLLFFYRPCRGFFWTESLIGILALVGAVAAFCADGPNFPAARRSIARKMGLSPSLDGSAAIAPQHRLWRFLAIYTLVLAALYSAIPYKTPWCMLSFLHGTPLLAGLGAWTRICRLPGRAAKLVLVMLLLGATGQLGWQCYRLNFRFPADVRNPYVYAHTAPDVLNLAARVEQLAELSPPGQEMLIHVVTPDNYWPLPWYLRRFKAGYWQDAQAWQRAVPHSPPPAIIIFTPDVQPEIAAGLRAKYGPPMLFGLRPGVLLTMYVRDELWRAFLAAAERKDAE